MQRREFIRKGAVAAIGVPSITKALGRDRIRMGFIGIGNRGTQVMRVFQRQPEIDVVALCDCYEPYLKRDASAIDPKFYEYGIGGAVPKFGADDQFGPEVKRYSDYRRLLDDKNVDAVMIATPDHWHAIMTIDAIKAGKDVYCEKPLSATIVEGREMVNAQKASKQVVAVGLNRRGSVPYIKLAEEIKSGKWGKFIAGHGARLSNLAPNGIGKCPDCPPPKGLDWNAWLGPRAYRPYRYTTAPYYFRWHEEFSSQMGNWGVHYCDVMRWMLGETFPCAITAVGGTYSLDHDADIPDTIEVTYEFADKKLIHFAIYEGATAHPIRKHEIELAGTDGVIYAGESGFEIEPQGRREFSNPKEPKFAPFTYKHKQEMMPDGSWAGSTLNVVRDFIERVKDRREPLCTLETGHRSTSFALLGNIAFRMGQRLEWDGEKERFTNCEKANDLLHYTYREGYHLG